MTENQQYFYIPTCNIDIQYNHFRLFYMGTEDKEFNYITRLEANGFFSGILLKKRKDNKNILLTIYVILKDKDKFWLSKTKEEIGIICPIKPIGFPIVLSSIKEMLHTMGIEKKTKLFGTCYFESQLILIFVCEKSGVGEYSLEDIKKYYNNFSTPAKIYLQTFFINRKIKDLKIKN